MAESHITITLTIQLTDRPDAATMVYDGLHDALYALYEAGAINDYDYNG